MATKINVADLVVGIEGDSSGLQKTLKTSLTGANTWSTALGNIVATGITSLIGGALTVLNKGFTVVAAGMSKATTMATDFQSQLVGLNIAASTTGLTFDELHDISLLVGGDTRLLGVSATGAADSMTNLFKAGLSASDVLGDFNGFLEEGEELGGALRAAIDLAAASELDMVDASDLAVITMKTFGIGAEDITSAMNSFVQTADASVANVSDLRDAMVNVGPVAAGFGFSLEDTNNALALLSSRGIKGAEAGTALKSMLTNMMRATPKVQGALEAINVELFDQAGNMKSLPDIISQFQTGLEGLTEEQRLNAIQTIAGTFGMKSLQTLLAEGTEGWDAMAMATANAAGIQTQAAAKANTMAGAMEALEGTVETFWIGLGEVGLPILQRLVEWASGMASEHGPTVVAMFQNMVTAVMPFIDTILGALESGTLFQTLFAMLPEGMQGFITMLMETVPEAIATTQGFLSVISAWLGEILPVAIQVASDYWNLYLLPAFMALAEAWTTTIQPALAELGAWLQERVPQAIAALAAAWETYGVPFFTALGAFISEVVIPAFAQLAAWLITNIPLAIDTMVTFWNETFIPALQAAWAWIQENLIPVFQMIWDWLAVNIPAAIEAAKAFWEETLVPSMETVKAWIDENLIPIFETVKEWLDTNLPIAIEALKTFWEETLLPSMEIIHTFIQDKLLPLWEALAEFFDVTMTLALEALAGLWENILQPVLQVATDLIKDKLVPAFELLESFWTLILQPAIETLADLFTDTLLMAWVGLITALTTAKDTVLPKVKEAFTFIGGAIEKVIEFVKKLTEKIGAIELPPWLKSDSPPPLFFSLKLIGGAMRDLSTQEIPQLNRALDNMGSASVTGRLSANVSPIMDDVALAAQLSGGGGDTITNNNFNLPQHLSTDPDRRLEDTVAFLSMAAGGGS